MRYSQTTLQESRVAILDREMSLGKSKDASLVDSKLIEAYRHYSLPSSRLITLKRFYNLRELWMREKLVKSSLTEIVLNSHYQQIIGMGPAVIPYILQSLIAQPDYWFHALSAITGENPIRPENRGDLKAMTGDWINWGMDRGWIDF